ncbi:MAG: prepilin-type N-terminal cleavage/methylation domain-containing protein, partial [Sulfuricella sp.]
MKKISSGFTLLELVVALAIFALISVFAYRAL